MTIIAVTGALISAAGSVYGGMASAQQGKYEQAVANQNAELEIRAQRDTISRGETDQKQHYRKLAQAMGEARVRNASTGLDVSFGSAASLEDDIALIGGEDALALNENTIKQVQGYDISANNYRTQGKAAAMRGTAAKTAGFIGAAGTLLSSASQIGNTNTAAGRAWYGGPKS